MSKRVVLFRAVDPDYARSRRVAERLRSLDVPVVRVAPAQGGRLRRACTDAVRLARTVRSGDVILLAEMQLQSAPVAAFVARLRRCALVVDGFIGLRETYTGDWAVTRSGSMRDRLYDAVDRFARRRSDLFLIDTEPRAAAVRTTTRTTVLALPVGAPAWAEPGDPAPSTGPLRVLYYGNYIPLHGLGTVVRAIELARTRVDLTVTFLGTGADRPTVERLAEERGLGDTVRFTDPVPERELAEVIAGHHVVLGVFGDSDKAAGVVANKVWQGLACGRRVITRRSTALEPLRDVVGAALVEVPAADPDALAEALVEASAERGALPDVSAALELIVDRGFAPFDSWIRAAVTR